MTSPIVIERYDQVWPAEFSRLARPLHEALGELALRIDHIGSTAVPGLAAKDIIDIQVTVRELSPAVEEALNSIGYTRHVHLSDQPPPGVAGPESDWSKWVFKPPAGQRPTNLHVRVQGRPNQRFALLFRDYLRAHPPAAQAYSEIKQQLAGYHADDSDAYYAVKDPVMALIWFAAAAWAAQTNWQPAAS